jgi:LPXTG-motif cell wall-anchored protein
MEGARRLQRLGIACLILAAATAPPALSSAQEESPAPAAAPPAATNPAPAPGTPTDSGGTADASGRPPADKSDADAPAPADVVIPASGPTPAPAAATSKQPKAVAAASALVSIGDNFFSPATVSVAVGDTVTWKNNGQAQHSATASNGSFDTGIIAPGQSRSHTFTTAGTFSYFCTVHGTAQSGTVRVAAASGGGGGDGNAGSSSSGQSEASAVASADAAGDANTLPLTGFASLSLALVGLALLASGIVIRRFEDQKRRRFLGFPLR